MRTSDGLPPFSGNTADCPKCGSCVPATWHPCGGFGKDFPCESRHDLDEHMCRSCEACGYGWLEATKDASASEPRRLRPAR
jgi:hypothetical protein